MDTKPFTARRITRKYRQTIDAAPDTVFPLLCPVRESEWLDGWDYTMLFSRSGLVEQGAVFTTRAAGEDDTAWIVTRHDPVQHLVEFARFTPRSRVCSLRIHVLPDGRARSFVDITYTYTSITEAGNDFIDGLSEAVFLESVIFWEKSMNHWLATGDRLPKMAG